MASLYKRATPSQRRILRAVEGAIKNAAHAHPEIQISPPHRRSIAKRAAGTLTAQWPDVLAARVGASSESGDGPTLTGPWRQPPQGSKAAARGALRLAKRTPWRVLIQQLSRPLTELKAAGLNERAEAYIDVLKMIHRLRTEGPSALEEPPR